MSTGLIKACLTVKIGPRSVLLRRRFDIPTDASFAAVWELLQPAIQQIQHMEFDDKLYFRPKTRVPDSSLVQLTDANYTSTIMQRLSACRNFTPTCDFVLFGRSEHGLKKLEALNPWVVPEAKPLLKTKHSELKPRLPMVPRYSESDPQFVIDAVRRSGGRVHIWARCNSAFMKEIE